MSPVAPAPSPRATADGWFPPLSHGIPRPLGAPRRGGLRRRVAIPLSIGGCRLLSVNRTFQPQLPGGEDSADPLPGSRGSGRCESSEVLGVPWEALRGRALGLGGGTR